MNKLKFHLFLFAIGFSGCLFSQEIDYTKIPQLQTKATYTKEVQPDKITLSITLSENNSKGKVTLEELEKKMFDILKSNNIDLSKKLSLKDLSSNFQSYFLKGTTVQKTKNYYLELESARLAGKVLKDLSENDISNVKLLKTEYSKLEELKIKLKGNAVEKAKQQAEEMAGKLNVKIGRVLFISDSETDVVNLLGGRVSGVNIRGANSISGYNNFNESELDISFDNIIVEVSATVFFEIK
jgi:hypothetical protein